MSTDISLNVCNNISYLNSVNQKKRFQLFNIPNVRYNNLDEERNPYLKIDPNTNKPYTKFDIDMKRKVEILKYSSNRMSTQTNNLTRAQKYAQAISGSYQQRTFSREFIEKNTENNVLTICPTGTIITTSTTASDVPGTPIMLYDNPTVPLYNLINKTNTPYAIINQQLNPYPLGFNYINKTDISNNDSNNNKIYEIISTLYFFNVGSMKYNLSFTIPIFIKFSGTNLYEKPLSSKNSFKIKLNSISLEILYSYSSLPIISNYTSLNKEITVDISDNTIPFSGMCYFDTVTFNNIILQSKLGYIYDFKLNINYNIIKDNIYTLNYDTPIINTYFNRISSIISLPINCIISPISETPTNRLSTITGEPIQ